MHFTSTIVSLALVRFSVAGYTLQDDYSVSNFFNMFDFYTGGDPTNGFVQYVDQGTAQSSGLISATNSVYIGVDSSNVAPSGRKSVRLSSKNSYNYGLVILDLAHMPGSICGTWPAFWMLGPNWPNEGEIDIIEGVNANTVNQMTLHTGAGCTISPNNAGSFTGTAVTTNCDINAAGQGSNAGCGIATSDTTTYGNGFNAAGGGVYAMEWTTSGIAVWHFTRGSIPGDISSGTPNPSGWGLPLARFSNGSCNYSTKFQNQQIIFDITFCGDWAGAVWGSDSQCAPKASSCNNFVANNPTAFQQTYWQINSLRVYQQSAVRHQASRDTSAEFDRAAPFVPKPAATTLQTLAKPAPSSATSATDAPDFSWSG